MAEPVCSCSLRSPHKGRGADPAHCPVHGDTMPTSQRCPIGALNLHTYNHERTECIWCGPGRLAFKPGRWVEQGDGTSAWSVSPA